MKFKVGDKVKFIGKLEEHYVVNTEGESLQQVIDKNKNVFTISNTSNTGFYFSVKEDEFWQFSENELELINTNISKKKLLKMPIGTKIITDLKNNNEFVFDGSTQFNSIDDYIEEYEINEDLTLKNKDYGTKIIKIQKPTYETIYIADEEVKEMTISEIEKKLGYSIKIVKEEE